MKKLFLFLIFKSSKKKVYIDALADVVAITRISISMSLMQAWGHLQMWAIRGLSGARNTQLRYPTAGAALGRQFSFAASRSGSVQIRSAGTTALPLQR